MTLRLIGGLALVMLFAATQQACGQEKYEREHRLKPEDVPQPALDFIVGMEKDVNVRWYWEEGLDRASIEAKFKLDNRNYSVEFDTTGLLEDLEIELALSELGPIEHTPFSFQIAEDCEKHKIRKLQIQYNGTAEEMLAWITKGGPSPKPIRYELVVKCTSEGETTLYEYLFSENLDKLSRTEIVFKNSSNLEY